MTAYSCLFGEGITHSSLSSGRGISSQGKGPRVLGGGLGPSRGAPQGTECPPLTLPGVCERRDAPFSPPPAVHPVLSRQMILGDSLSPADNRLWGLTNSRSHQKEQLGCLSRRQHPQRVLEGLPGAQGDRGYCCSWHWEGREFGHSH